MKRRAVTGMEFSKEDLLQTILAGVAPLLVCIGVIVMQPDLGTSVDIVLIMTAILFVAGLSWKWLAVGAAAALAGLIALIAFVSSRFGRVRAVLHPVSDLQGAGFELWSSRFAVGSGSSHGVGLMQGEE